MRSQVRWNSTEICTFIDGFCLPEGSLSTGSWFIKLKNLALYYTWKQASVRMAEHLAFLTSDYKVPGSNPTGGRIQSMTLWHFIVQSFSLSPFHCIDNDLNNVGKDIKHKITITMHEKNYIQGFPWLAFWQFLFFPQKPYSGPSKVRDKVLSDAQMINSTLFIFL